MRVKLGDVCTVISGSTPKTGNTEFWDGDIDWITPAELTDESFIVHESVRKITQAAVVKTGLRSFPAGTVILSSRAPIGKVAIAGKEMYCNQGFKNLICGSMIHHEYLYWFLKGKTEYLNSLGRGATFKEISKSIVEKVEIPLPAMPEQMKCAATFKAIWGIINLRKQQLAELDNLVKCRFMEQFGGPGIQSRYPTVTLGSISNMISGGTPSSKHPEYFGGNIPFVSTPCLGPNFIDASAAQNWLTELGVQMSSTHIVPANSLMVGNRVGVGKSSINTCEMCTNQDILSFVDINTDKFDLLFVKKVIEQYGPIFESQKRGATIKGVPSDLVKASQIPQVPIDVQRAFVGFVRQTDKFKFVVQQSLDETQKLFDSFMQEYFDS